MRRQRTRKSRQRSEPRRHHFVPRGFLRQWCADGKTLHRFRRTPNGLAHDRIDPRHTAFAENLYNIRSPYRDSLTIQLVLNILEDRFGELVTDLNLELSLMDEVDRRGIEAQRKFLARPIAGADPPDQEMIYDLLRFLYLLSARNIFTLQYVQEASFAHLQKLVADAGLSSSIFLNLEDLRADLNSAKLSVVEAVLNEEDFRKRFNATGCVPIWTDRTQKAFVTSNCPYPARDKSTVHFATLSPELALITSQNVDMLEAIKRYSNANLLDVINFAAMAFADEVYAWDDRELQQIDQYMGLFNSDSDRAVAIMQEMIKKSVSR
jgi:Protein of unknown function (DUF4238)